MGYSVFQLYTEFFIAEKDQYAALDAIKKIAPEIFYPNSIDPHFAFVDDVYKKAKTLDEALRAWRWASDVDDDDNIISIEFRGEKLGDECILFSALAPFTRNGSSIQMAGEDGQIWRWLFLNKTVRKQKAEIIFHDEE